MDNGQYPKIERVSLDVSNSSRKTIVSYGISSPRDIFVDVYTNDVYWVDSVVDAIQVCHSLFIFVYRHSSNLNFIFSKILMLVEIIILIYHNIVHFFYMFMLCFIQ